MEKAEYQNRFATESLYPGRQFRAFLFMKHFFSFFLFLCAVSYLITGRQREPLPSHRWEN